MLPAIVLTCDRYHPFATHMILRYETVWPSHPFTFHVPYQERPLGATAGCSRIEPRRTHAPIRATVLDLLAEFDDQAWVYWCIDDKYPIEFAQPAVAQLAEAVSSDPLPGIDGLSCCRCRKLLLPQHLTGERRVGPGGMALLGRNDYSQIWLHQFLRVKVLRHLFLHLPERVDEAKALDSLKYGVALPPDHRLYVVETNLAVFGESTLGGRMTANCVASFKSSGLEMPDGFGQHETQVRIMGHIV